MESFGKTQPFRTEAGKAAKKQGSLALLTANKKGRRFYPSAKKSLRGV
jgi:hypothetical protein